MIDHVVWGGWLLGSLIIDWVLQPEVSPCEYKGCVKSGFSNYDLVATIEGECQGCMDSTADNFQPEADLPVRLLGVRLEWSSVSIH